MLDSNIAWSKSALNARCQICRRKTDGEHMLLCDGCDRGHHLYCLKPPLKVSFVHTNTWFGSENSTTAEEVSKFQRLFPNLQLFEAMKGIRSPKTCSNTLNGQLPDGYWSTKVKVKYTVFDTPKVVNSFKAESDVASLS